MKAAAARCRQAPSHLPETGAAAIGVQTSVTVMSMPALRALE